MDVTKKDRHFVNNLTSNNYYDEEFSTTSLLRVSEEIHTGSLKIKAVDKLQLNMSHDKKSLEECCLKQ